MKSVFKAYGTDQTACKKGVWHEFYQDGELVARLRLRPENPAINADWRRARLEIAKELRRWAQENDFDLKSGQPIPEEVDLRIMAQSWYKNICTDWEVQDDDGPIPFNKKNFVRVMSSLPLLFDVARQRAQRLEAYRQTFEEEAVKD